LAFCRGPSPERDSRRPSAYRYWIGPLPPSANPCDDMTSDMVEPVDMREGDCPFCERTVLIYEDPPRCPLCACPLEEHAVRPYSFPETAPEAD
jgi:hypothetical protein